MKDLSLMKPSNRRFILSFIIAISIHCGTMAQAPTSLNYPAANVFIANVTNAYLAPTVAGSVVSYGITPALPTGLSFNVNTGVISGVASVSSAAANYTITATNGSGSTNRVISIQVTNNYFDVAGGAVSFLGANAVNKTGTGTAAGNIVLYTNVITLSGTQIDCIVTTRTISNGSFTTYDQNQATDPASTPTWTNNDPAFFSPQLTFTAAGSVTFDFQYILGGSFNDATKTGANVVLQNVKLNTYDIDGNGSATQYVEFGGFNNSELGTTTNQLVTFTSATSLTRYTSNTSANTSSIVDPKNRIRVSYNNMSSFTIIVGASGSGAAYYFLDFSVGSVAFTTTSTSAPTIDLNTTLPGVVNGASGCGSALPFTASSQTNGASTANLSQLSVAFPTSDIVDGVSETMTFNGATAGGSIPLNSDASTTLTFATGSFTAARVTASGIRTITFTSGTTITLARAEELLDAMRYTNVSTAPTARDRNFTVKMRNTTFESPDAIFTATLNCVSISGNIYHDANGLTNNTVDANSTMGQFANNGVYALLINPVNNQVTLSQGVTSGAYNFGTATPGNYIVMLSATNQTAGTVITSATYPTGNYISVGENLGAGIGNDLLIDGKILITVGTVTATNVNFGLQIPPVTTSGTLANQSNPGGFNNYAIPNGSFGATDADGSIASITITSFPSGANYLKIGSTVYPNPSGGICPPLTTCTSWPGTVTVTYSSGNPSQTISVDPSADVTTSIVIDFTVTDNGAAASNSSTLTIPYVVTNYYSISGNVWHDYNGDGSKGGSEPLTNIAGASENLYAILVQNNNTYSSVPTVFSTSAVNASTGYSFTGVPAANNYEIRIASKTSSPVSGSAASAVTPTLAPGWAGVSVNSNGTITTLLNTSNPTITLLNLASAKTNLNFGIEKMPVADGKIYTAVATKNGPVNVVSVVNTKQSATTYLRSLNMTGNLSSGGVPGLLTGSDPDGNTGGTSLSIASGTAGISLVIDPANYGNTGSVSLLPTMLTYNSIQLNAGGCAAGESANAVCNYYNAVTGYWEIPNYDGTLLKILGTAKTTQLSFKYAWKDAAGAIGSFSTYSVGFDFALPLTLLSFDGKSNSHGAVFLEWETANEYNTDHFDIEHSSDGLLFTKAGTVEAAGESIGRSYHFTHQTPVSGNNYYRLAMYDRDGSFQYSGIKLVKTGIMNSEVLIAPNPVKNGAAVSVKWRSLTAGYANVVIYDPAGKKVHTGKLDGSGKAEIQINSWISGIYYVWLKSANTQEIRKLIID